MTTTYHEAARRGFTKGSTTYKCRVCTRRTRSTGNGDNENVKLCVQCWEVAGIENAIADGQFENLEHKTELLKEIAALNAEVVAKGGVIEGINAPERKPETHTAHDGDVHIGRKSDCRVCASPVPVRHRIRFVHLKSSVLADLYLLANNVDDAKTKAIEAMDSTNWSVIETIEFKEGLL